MTTFDLSQLIAAVGIALGLGVAIGTFIGIHYHRVGVEDGLKMHGLMDAKSRLDDLPMFYDDPRREP